VGRRGHDRPGDHAVLEHLSLVVDVGEEELEHPDALLDPALDPRPGLHLDDARKDVEGKRALLAADVERDALVQVGGLEGVRPVPELRLGHLRERCREPVVRRTDPVPVHHLVVCGPGVPRVSVEHVGHFEDPNGGSFPGVPTLCRHFGRSNWPCGEAATATCDISHGPGWTRNGHDRDDAGPRSPSSASSRIGR